MNCPNCQHPVRSDATSCDNCSFDLVGVVVGGAGGEPAPARSRRPSWLIFAGVGAAVLAVGLTAWALGPEPSGATYTGRFPADAIFFAEVDMAEVTSADSRALIEAFAPLIESQTGEPFDLDTVIDEIIDQFDSQLGDIDLSFRDDIASWASGPVAVGVLPDQGDVPAAGVVLVGGDDAAALDDFLAKLSSLPQAGGDTVEIGGVSFLRLGTDENGALAGRQGNDLVVATDAEAAETVIAPVAGSTLADVPEFAAQMSRLPGHAAAVFAVNGASLSQGLGDLGMGLTDSGIGSGWTAGALTSDSDGFRVDYVADLGDGPAPSYAAELTAALPADTVAFIRLGAVLHQVEALMGSDMAGGMANSVETEFGFSIEDILAVFAVDGGVAVWPSTDPELPVNAALVGVAETSQSGFIDDLAELSGSMGLVATPVEGGYTVNGLFSVGTRDTLTLFTTDRDLITGAPSDSFTEGALYTRAHELVDGDLIFAFDMPAIVDLVDGFIGAGDPEAADMLRCLPLGVAAGGVTVADGAVHTSTIVEIVARC